MSAEQRCIGSGSDSTYPTVCAVRSASLLGGLVDLNVLHHQIAGIQALRVGVRFGVLQQAEEEVGRLYGPSCA
jgi:hypothetical protein